MENNLIFIWYIIGAILLFFILREFWCWYFKFNEIASLLRKIEENTNLNGYTKITETNKNMKRIILVHGWGGSSESDFFPYLKDEFQRLGYLVSVPDMPDTDNPDIKKWVSKLSEVVGTPDRNTYFVGHSIGCQTILRYLEATNLPVGGAIFVAGWFNLENLESDESVKIADPWINTPINIPKVKSLLPKSTLIISDNDPYGCLKENREKFSKIVSKEVVVKNAGHFNPEDGYEKIPLVVKEMLDIVAK